MDRFIRRSRCARGTSAFVGAAALIGSFVAAGSAVAGGGSTVADVSGTWEAKFTCKGQYLGEKAKIKITGEMGISQSGSVLAAGVGDLSTDGLGGGPRGLLSDAALCGDLEDTTGKPGTAQGNLGFLDQTFGPAAGSSPGYPLMLHLSKIKVGDDGSGSIKGVGVYSAFLGVAANCKVKLVRITDVDPGIDPSSCTGGP